MRSLCLLLLLSSAMAQVTLSGPGSLSGNVTISPSTPLVITTTTLASPTVNQPYSQSLQASGGTLPYVWTLASGALPPGLSLNSSNGNISGIPTASGPFSFTVKVTDSAGASTAPIGYVTSRENDNLSIINTANNTLTGVVSSVGAGPYRAVITPNGRFVYNTNGGASNGNTVTVTDTHTNNVLGTITVGVYPLGITITPDGSTIYVGNRIDLTISVIDVATNTVKQTISGGVLSTGVMELCNDGTTVYVTNKASAGRLHMIRISDNTLQGDITVGTQPFGCSYNPINHEIYVANGNGGANGSVSVISTASHTVTHTISVGAGPDEIATTPNGMQTYVTLQSDGSGTNTGVGLLDTNPASGTAYTQLKIIPVCLSANGCNLANNSPNGMATSPDGTTAYATLFGDATGTANIISVINTSSNVETSTIVAGGYGLNSITLAPVVVGNTANKALSITVNPGPPVITSNSSLPNATQGSAYSFTFTESGGQAPFNWTTTGGAWPTGLTLSSAGVLSGTPSVSGTFTATVQVTDSLSQTASGSFTLTVSGGSGGGTGTGQDPLPTGLGWHDLVGTAMSAFRSAGGCDQTLVGSGLPGSGNCQLTITDWNGAAMADNSSHHWLVWGVGGGHNDYYGNELYGFDLSVAPYGKLFRLNNSTPSSQISTGGSTTYGDGRPDARHDYGGIAYDPVRDAMFLEGGARSGTNGGQEGGDTWEIPLGNLPALNSTWAFSHLTSSGPTTGTFSYAGQFDANSGLMWWRTTGFLYSFNFSTNTWTQQSGSNQGGGDYSSSLVINDSTLPAAVRHLFITAGNTALVATNITTPGSVPAGVSHSSDSGCSTIAGMSAPGIAYDPVAQDIVVYNGSGSTYYTIAIPNNTAGGWTCTANTNFTTGAPGSTNDHNGGMWGFFSYSPYCDCFLTLNASTTDLFILRLRTPAPNNFGQRSAGVNTPGGSGSVFNSESFDNIIPAPPTDTCHIGGVNGGRYECFTYNGLSNVLSRDCTTTAEGYSGDCSLHWTIPAGTNTNPGEFYMNFSPDFSKVFGQTGQAGAYGNEFYVQYRVRYDAAVINGTAINLVNGDPTKLNTIGEGDTATYGAPACDNYPAQYTIEGTTYGNLNIFPLAFINCGGGGLLNFAFGTGNYQPLQLSGPSNIMDQVATGCPHYRDAGHAAWDSTDVDLGGTGTCWNYTGSEWFTIQQHMKIGTWNQPNSVVDIWMQHAGKPARLIDNAADAGIPNSVPNGIPPCGPTTHPCMYGKGKFSPYTTNCSGCPAQWVATTNIWYDDIIFSTRRIPDPGVATPNEPDSLSISVTNHVPTISWRVNSNNGTAQDDTGFLVERCTGSTSNCMPSPQSGFAQLNSGTCSSLPAHTSSCADSTAVAGTTYTYRVRATNATGNSGYAEAICFNGSGSNCGGSVTP